MKTIRFTVLIVASAWVLTACGGVGVGVPTPSDTTAPTISRVAVEPSTLIVPGATSVRVEAHVTDDGSGVDAVTVKATYPDGSEATHTLSAGSGATYTVQFAPSWGGSQPGNVQFVVSARDKAGNSGSASVVSVRSAAPPPATPW
jgi:hypothetical protein